MARLIDTHAHLTFPELESQLEMVLARARAAGVNRILTVGTDPEDNEAVLAMADQHAELCAIVGIHAHEADKFQGVESLKPLLSHPKVVGLGETGLDYHYTFAQRDNQRRNFEAHLELGQATNLPVVVHCREAFDDVLGILRSAGPGVRGVVHCFSGGVAETRAVLDLGWYISFSGTVTFKSAETLRAAAKFVGLDRLLIETDCPFLSPEPVRKNKVNEPANVLHTATRLAELRGMKLNDFGEKVFENAIELFGERIK